MCDLGTNIWCRDLNINKDKRSQYISDAMKDGNIDLQIKLKKIYNGDQDPKPLEIEADHPHAGATTWKECHETGCSTEQNLKTRQSLRKAFVQQWTVWAWDDDDESALPSLETIHEDSYKTIDSQIRLMYCEKDKMLAVLDDANIDHRYSELIKNIYTHATVYDPTSKDQEI